MRFAALLFLCQTFVVAFKPTPLPNRRSVQLNSLLDEAYDVPSIAGTYSRSSSTAPTSSQAAVKKIAEVTSATSEAAARKVTQATEAAVQEIPKVKEVAESTVATVSSATEEASKQVSSAVDEFVRAANENLPAVKSSVTASFSSGLEGFQPLISPLTPREYVPSQPLEPGKVRDMYGFIRESLENGGLTLPTGENMADAKNKIGLLVSNSYQLIGKEAPQTIPDISIPDISDTTYGWIAAAFAAAIALNQRSAGVEDAKVAMGDMVQKEAAAVSEIAEQLKSMGGEIKVLNKETKALSKELQAAKTKLTEKELALSKNRLAAADKELQLNRAIDQLKIKLNEADTKMTLIDKAVSVETSSPVAEVVAKAKQNVTKGSAKKAPAKQNVTKGSAKKAPAKQDVIKGSVKKVRVVKAKATKGEKKAPAAKKKTVVKKKTTVVKKKTTVLKKKAAVKKAKTAKTVTKAKVPAATKEEASWSELSQSTLSRKTVKQLSDYLIEKGVSTTGDDGKRLKKAFLVKAIQAL